LPAPSSGVEDIRASEIKGEGGRKMSTTSKLLTPEERAEMFKDLRGRQHSHTETKLLAHAVVMDDKLAERDATIQRQQELVRTLGEGLVEQARRIAELEEALRTLPLWSPEPRENRVKDPLYGWTAPEFYPASVLVDSEKLVAARRVLESMRAAIGEKP
jgi:hypothetical protein